MLFRSVPSPFTARPASKNTMGPGGQKDFLSHLSQLSSRQLIPAGIAAFCTLVSLWYFFSSPSSGLPSPYGSAFSSQVEGAGGQFLQSKLRESERIWRASVKRRLAWFKKMGGMAQVSQEGDGRYTVWDMVSTSSCVPGAPREEEKGSRDERARPARSPGLQLTRTCSLSLRTTARTASNGSETSGTEASGSAELRPWDLEARTLSSTLSVRARS